METVKVLIDVALVAFGVMLIVGAMFGDLSDNYGHDPIWLRLTMAAMGALVVGAGFGVWV